MNNLKPTYYILLLLLSLGIGFGLGRSTVKTKETVKFVKGETIIADYPTHLLTPKREIKGNLVDLPNYLFRTIEKPIHLTDTLIIEQIKEIDTLALVEDYITKREYQLTLFDDENGKLTIEQIIQFNAIQSLSHRFTPIQKQITVNKEKRFTPFVLGAYNDVIGFGLGGGVYLHNLGFNYMRYENNSNSFGLSYKF